MNFAKHDHPNVVLHIPADRYWTDDRHGTGLITITDYARPCCPGQAIAFHEKPVEWCDTCRLPQEWRCGCCGKRPEPDQRVDLYAPHDLGGETVLCYGCVLFQIAGLACPHRQIVN